MKIIPLVENVVYTHGIKAEHGLCIYIETDSTKILFDTGQSGLFLENAKRLHISIEDIDVLILSHGHYDHTGGLYEFIAQNTKAVIYAKKDICTPKFHADGRTIGTPYKPEMLENRMTYLDSITHIDSQLSIIPNISIYFELDTHFSKMFVQSLDGLIEDTFTDELFVVLHSSESISIITACSHRGITNICKTAQEIFKKPIYSVIGGFHTKDADNLQYELISQFCNTNAISYIGVCHCTGVEMFARMKQDIVAKVEYVYTGKYIEL